MSIKVANIKAGMNGKGKGRWMLRAEAKAGAKKVRRAQDKQAVKEG